MGIEDNVNSSEKSTIPTAEIGLMNDVEKYNVLNDLLKKYDRELNLPANITIKPLFEKWSNFENKVKKSIQVAINGNYGDNVDEIILKDIFAPYYENSISSNEKDKQLCKDLYLQARYKIFTRGDNGEKLRKQFNLKYPDKLQLREQQQIRRDARVYEL
jgi:hypothetical protein